MCKIICNIYEVSYLMMESKTGLKVLYIESRGIFKFYLKFEFDGHVYSRNKMAIQKSHFSENKLNLLSKSG